jgi:ankyrin repeat protein
MIHSLETEPNKLCKSCASVQDPAQVQFETLLNDAAQGHTENVRKAVAKDRTLASRRGMDNRTLAWVATYRNRPKILELTLKAGGDCNTPACDPMRATMACDDVQMGTGVAVTPLAIAKKWQPALARRWWSTAPSTTCSRRRGWATCPARPCRAPSGARQRHRSRRRLPGSLALCHAVCGGSIDAVKLLLERGARKRGTAESCSRLRW